MDLRITKTESAIKSAFIELRSFKPLEKITVKELCQLACINKSTFYSHYQDIYALSDALEEEAVSSIINSIAHPEYIKDKMAEFSRELCTAFISQKTLTTILFSGNARNRFADRIESGVKEMIYEKCPEYRTDAIKNIILCYCIQGSYHAFTKNTDVDTQTLVSVIEQISEKLQCLYRTE
ncbi:MAG: TetR/AcrR family transcriptional regulator [Eubacteriales bacterium]|nr:TetR/AcrR family transcriptional regulator [Eubacteriales bacterium]